MAILKKRAIVFHHGIPSEDMSDISTALRELVRSKRVDCTIFEVEPSTIDSLRGIPK